MIILIEQNWHSLESSLCLQQTLEVIHRHHILHTSGRSPGLLQALLLPVPPSTGDLPSQGLKHLKQTPNVPTPHYIFNRFLGCPSSSQPLFNGVSVLVSNSTRESSRL